MAAGDIAVPPAREDCDIVGLFDFARTGDPHRRGFEAMMYLDEHPYIGVDDNHRDVLLNAFAGKTVRAAFLIWSGLNGGDPKTVIHHRI